MSDHQRVCQRAGCQQSATVTLSFRYDARQASLVDLSADKDPAYYDLCAFHADVLIVPKGWERLDRRTPPPEPESDVATPPAAVDSDPRMDRYAALTAELPRLAEACGLIPPSEAWTGAGRGTHKRVDRATAPAPVHDPEPSTPRVSAADPEPAGGGGHPYEPVTRTLLEEEVFELEGQLQMPIGQEQRGVVVALTRTRNA
jgi:hypothetical protein